VARDTERELAGEDIVGDGGASGRGNVSVNASGEGRLAFALVTICFGTYREHHRYAACGREKRSYAVETKPIGK
jgi:hypothetical protein